MNFELIKFFCIILFILNIFLDMYYNYYERKIYKEFLVYINYMLSIINNQENINNRYRESDDEFYGKYFKRPDNK
jgi:hypothetical protein